MSDTILAIDPSGNFHEGKGTTGYCYLGEDGKIILGEIKAKEYESQELYWYKVLETLWLFSPKYLVYETYQLYHHKGMKAETQANSFLETPQLIGAIRMTAYRMGISSFGQSASEVKTRWSDKILQAKGYLGKGNTFQGQRTNDHKRDALRHALHFQRYKLDKI